MADDADADDTAIQAFLESLAAEEPALVKSILARPLEVATHQAASHAPEASQQLSLEAAMPTFCQGCPVAAIRLRHSSPHVDDPASTVPFAGPKHQFDPALGASFYAANFAPPLKFVAAEDDAATIEVLLAFPNTSFKAHIGHTGSASVPTMPCYDETSLNATPTELLQATLDASSNPISKLDLFDAYIVVPLFPEHHFHPLPIESLFHTDSQAATTLLSCFPNLTLTNAQAFRVPGKYLLPWIPINFDPGGEAYHGVNMLFTSS
ncbi:hypothetical protein GOP47_0025923 [Adiantum capillus-veneris]|uniref:Uncharacterized protein n=1 Tax=Adiantum capillus-veneris TaxID=13818 RepID=A0A9D4Z3B9_ADICA|nr:hypothetical protein GOP47_0025923 [Adiantum capillus-veneris]